MLLIRQVNACATLHNIRIHYNLPIPEEEYAGLNMNSRIINENLEVPYIDQRGGPQEVVKRIQKQILDWFDHLRD